MHRVVIVAWGIMLGVVYLIPAAASAADGPIVMKLWAGDPPYAIVDAPPETVDERGSVGNVSVPEISVHLPPPDRANGMALIVCPGGSYRKVGRYAGGAGAVERFVPRGVAVVVVKYRTIPPSRDVFRDALADATRAVRMVRHHGERWGIDSQCVGMLGGSAGAHLVLNTACQSDDGAADVSDPIERHSSRPDFIVLMCPWPGGQTIDAFAIDENMPPVFAASALDDTVAPTSFARDVISACKAAGVPSHLWTVPHGGHRAFSVGVSGPGSVWDQQVVDWLASLGMWPTASEK